MSKLRTFFCAFYFDRGAEDFILHAVYSDRAAADQSFDDLPDEMEPRHVAEMSLEGLKHHLLQAAIGQATDLRDPKTGLPLFVARGANAG